MTPQLKQIIQNLLAQLGAASPGFLQSAVCPKLYEIYVLALLVRALEQLGSTFSTFDSGGNPSTQLRFRLNPGRLHSPTTASSFILASYNGTDYEIQNGVRVVGKSGVLHELDVCLIDHVKAQRCRANRQDPKASDVKCLMECKFYGGDLDLGLGREFVGLAKEFSVAIRCFVSNEGSQSAARLIKNHDGYENFYLSPLNATHVNNQFVPWLAEQLRQSL